MIFRKYGSTLHSVETNFDPRAMNEIGFRKNDAQSLGQDEFEGKYERRAGHELSATAEGSVQNEAEERVLKALKQQLDRLEAELEAGAVLVVESEHGKDYPKMREKVSNVVVGNENRLHFERSVDPPLRIGVYAPRKS
ncbi:MAG: hypothetical protein ACT4O1_09635 [Gemmatimonadota bacterium]